MVFNVYCSTLNNIISWWYSLEIVQGQLLFYLQKFPINIELNNPVLYRIIKIYFYRDQ